MYVFIHAGNSFGMMRKISSQWLPPFDWGGAWREESPWSGLLIL